MSSQSSLPHGRKPKSRKPKDVPVVLATELNFITFTDLAETRKADSRRYVRAQVLKKYHAKRRSTKQEAQKQLEQPNRALAPRGHTEDETSASSEPSAMKLHSAMSLHKQPSPATCLTAGLVDSFSVLPIRLSSEDRFFLDRYIDFAYNLDLLIDTTRKKMPLTACYLPAAMKDSITLYSMLLTGAQCLEKSDYSLKSNRHARYYAAYYRGRLLQSINLALSDRQKTISDFTIAGLVKLETDEYLEGNRDQYNLHANALKKIIELCGGLQTLGMQGFLADLVLRVDQAAASYFASKPYFPQPLPKLCVSIESLNVGFLAPPILSNLSEETIGLLNDISKISVGMNNTNGELPDSGPVSWDTATECEKRLMIICAQRKDSAVSADVPDIQECICLATELYWMRVVRNYSARTYGGPLTSRELLESLNRLLSDEHSQLFQENFLELLLWAAFMGSLATDAPETVRNWTEMILRVSLKLAVRTWKDARTILKTFLWLEPLSESLGKSMWDQVEAIAVT